MKLTERFKRLTIWNKVGVLGAIASIAALFVTLMWPKSNGKTTTSSAKSKSGPAVSINEIRDSSVVIGSHDGHISAENGSSEDGYGRTGDDDAVSRRGSNQSSAVTTEITFNEFAEARRRRENLTALQNEQFFKYYVGKRVDWVGYVRDVSEHGDNVVIRLEPEFGEIFDSANCIVEGAQKDKWMTLSRGQKLRIHGTLTDRLSGFIFVDDCQVIRVWALDESHTDKAADNGGSATQQADTAEPE